MRVTVTILTWLISTTVLLPVCFFAVMILAGPHSDLLPDFLGGLVLILGWLALLGVPIWLSRLVWRKLALK